MLIPSWGVKTIGANRFVKIRNPWGSGTRAYFEDEKTHERTRERKDEDTEGIFLMELNEFMSTFDTVAIN